MYSESSIVERVKEKNNFESLYSRVVLKKEKRQQRPCKSAPTRNINIQYMHSQYHSFTAFICYLHLSLSQY